MAWRCRNCGRTYEDPPTECAICGGQLGPDSTTATPPSRFSLAAGRQRLLAPLEADTSLVDVDPRIRLAFRIVVVLTALLLAILVGAVLLG